jgi:putative nucleotidyltransferase with HDIG domain
VEQTYSDEARFPGSPITAGLVQMNLDHVERVRRNALEIASGEGLDADLLELAAILHDISKLDHREASSGGIDTWHHHARGASLARKVILVNLRKKISLADQIAQIIETHSDIPFIRRYWTACYHADLPTPQSREQIALRDADVIDMLWVGGMTKIVHFRQVPGSDFFKEDGGDIQKAIASARRSFEEAAGILTLRPAKHLAVERIETVQSFFSSLTPVKNLPEFVRVYNHFVEEHKAATSTHLHNSWRSK